MKKTKIYNGDVEITKENKDEWIKKLKGVTEITGNLSVYSNCDFKALTTIGGNLYVYSNCDFKALTTIGGYLSVSSNSKISAKCLSKINYKIFDNLVFQVESEKTTKGIKIYLGGNIRSIKKNKPTLEKCFVAEKDGFTAHGETIKKAMQDLQFKIISEKLKNKPIKKNTIITPEIYHQITGSCMLGIEQWMKRNNMVVESIKAVDLLPVLKKTNAYGYEKFNSLITF